MSKAEKFISDCTRTCSNELIAVESRAGKEVISYNEWLTPDQALKAVEIARGEITEKACEYLDGLIEILKDKGYGLKKKLIIGGLKQAMEND